MFTAPWPESLEEGERLKGAFLLRAARIVPRLSEP